MKYALRHCDQACSKDKKSFVHWIFLIQDARRFAATIEQALQDIRDLVEWWCSIVDKTLSWGLNSTDLFQGDIQCNKYERDIYGWWRSQKGRICDKLREIIRLIPWIKRTSAFEKYKYIFHLSMKVRHTLFYPSKIWFIHQYLLHLCPRNYDRLRTFWFLPRNNIYRQYQDLFSYLHNLYRLN